MKRGTVAVLYARPLETPVWPTQEAVVRGWWCWEEEEEEGLPLHPLHRSFLDVPTTTIDVP